MNSEEASAALLFAIGGALLVFTIEMVLAISNGSMGTQGVSIGGVLVYGIPEILVFLFGFLAFLLIGFGLLAIIRMATSSAQRPRE